MIQNSSFLIQKSSFLLTQQPPRTLAGSRPPHLDRIAPLLRTHHGCALSLAGLSLPMATPSPHPRPPSRILCAKSSSFSSTPIICSTQSIICSTNPHTFTRISSWAPRNHHFKCKIHHFKCKIYHFIVQNCTWCDSHAENDLFYYKISHFSIGNQGFWWRKSGFFKIGNQD